MSYTPALADLMEHEKVIEDPTASGADVRQAFRLIREGDKYKAAGYATYAEYYAKRWRRR